MATTKKMFNTKAILDKVYPIVANAIKNNYKSWKLCMSSFINVRNESLFDIAPCDRIYYTDKDRDELLAALRIDSKQITEGMKETYYWNKHPFKPSQAKDITTIIALCIVRYFVLNAKSEIDKKDLVLAMIYMSFSGKFYPSIHYAFFRVTAPSKYRHIMEYVVNNRMSQKYDLKSAGSVIGAVKNINNTWITSYTKQAKEFDDEDVCYMIEQLHIRIKAFMKNIAALYYESYKDKDYITYDKDSLPEEGDSASFHLTTNDSFRCQQYTERAMEKINTTRVDHKICMEAADVNVKAVEVQNIIEAILGERKNLLLIKELITLMIATFMSESKVKEVNSIQFLTYSLKQRANIKDPHMLRIKEIITNLLEDNSVSYRKRKHREPTRLSYVKAITYYFTLIIIKANK